MKIVSAAGETIVSLNNGLTGMSRSQITYSWPIKNKIWGFPELNSQP